MTLKLFVAKNLYRIFGVTTSVYVEYQLRSHLDYIAFQVRQCSDIIDSGAFVCDTKAIKCDIKEYRKSLDSNRVISGRFKKTGKLTEIQYRQLLQRADCVKNMIDDYQSKTKKLRN